MLYYLICRRVDLVVAEAPLMGSCIVREDHL